MIKTCSKWILAGEHTVIRGGAAIAFPCFDFQMSLRSSPCDHFIIQGDYSGSLADKIEEYIGSKINAKLLVSSTIPQSCGFGSSAALSVSLAKWIVSNGYFKNVFDLALYIENIFHKNGSGLDVHVILNERPILYSHKTGVQFIMTNWHPKIKMVIVKSEHSTKHCIQQVEDLLSKNVDEGRAVDNMMMTATRLCLDAINSKDIMLLAEGINLADSCFHRWGLYTKSMLDMSYKLRADGALAVKPLGGGLGGGMLALFFGDEKI